MEKWVSVQDYADSHNVTNQAVRAKIKSGTIQNKKIKGKIHVLDVDYQEQEQEITPASIISAQQELADLQYSLAMKDSKQLQNELKREKLKNLQQDTLIKKQKQTYTKQKYRQEYAEGVFQCFCGAFADVKKMIIELKLDREQMQKFQNSFKKSIKKFELELKKYLHDADKKELEENETE